MKLLCTCGNALEYKEETDLHLDRVFQFEKTYSSYLLLLEYESLVQRAHATFDGFHKSRCDLYAHVDQKFMAKSTFVNTWWAFLRRLSGDIDNLFKCPKCETLPDDQTIWILDGISLGIKKDKLKITPLSDCADSHQRSNDNW
jgi:hypothetical protein